MVQVRLNDGASFQEYLLGTPSALVGRTAGTGTWSFAVEKAGTNSFGYAQHAGTGVDHTGTYDMPFIVPDTHPPSTAIPAFTLTVRRSGASDSLTAKLYKNGVIDAGVNGVSIIATADVTYETKTITPTGTYSAGDELLLRITAINDNNESQRIANINIAAA